MMRLVAIGDVMGKVGRKALAKTLPLIRQTYTPDVIIVNGENAAGGFGLTKKIYQQMVGSLEIDCVTTGNHWHDKREIYDFLPHAERLLVPANMMNVEHIQQGFKVLESKTGIPYAVINVIGNAFMHPDNRNPFHCMTEILKQIPDHVKIRIVDFHAEATSEKQGMGRFLTGQASLVYGTHSHVPTADERILEAYTGFLTDVGMTGPYDSVIGIRTDAALARMTGKEKIRFEPASGDPWVPFIVADCDPKTGACLKIERVRWELSQLSF